MLDLAITNGLLCTEKGEFIGGIGVKGGVVVAVERDSTTLKAASTYDAEGNLVFPGAIDPHAHFGLNDLSRERFAKDIESETRAAAQGGITTVFTTTLFGEDPLPQLYGWALEGMDKAYVNVKVYVAPGSEEHIEEIPTVFEEGATAFKFLMAYRGEGARMFGMAEKGLDTAYLYRGFREIAKLGPPAIAMVHCEDPALFEYLTSAVQPKPTTNYVRAFHDARPNICEAIDFAKAAYVADEVDCPLYVVHLSAHQTVDQLQFLKTKGFNITGETCLHYLIFSCDDEIFEQGERMAKFVKVNPAIHDARSRERLWAGIADGTISTIGTDHNAYTVEKKTTPGFWTTTAGVGGGYSALVPLVFSEGVNKGRITLDTFRRVMCENPARTFGLYPRKGTLNVGADADILVLDPTAEWVIRSEDMDSANEFSVYEGMKVRGMPVATFVSGGLVAEKRKVLSAAPRGRVVV